MKYLVIDMINSSFDAYLHHESCIVTCSTGNFATWAFAKSKLFDSRDDAVEFAKKIFEEEYTRYEEDLYDGTGWYLDRSSYGGLNMHLCKEVEEGLVHSDWIYGVSILEVEDE